MSTAEMSTEVEILGRLFLNGESGLRPERARAWLELHFSGEDEARMGDLAAKNQLGRLTAAERGELLGYAKAGCLLGILHSRARRVLKKTDRRRRTR